MQPEKQTSSKGSTIGLALLFGVGAVSMSTSFNGFLVGAVLGALLAQVFHLRSRTQFLEEELRAIRQSLKAGVAAEKPIEPARAHTAESEAWSALLPTPTPSTASSEYGIAQAQAAAEK